jgi:hypothetical protein
MISHRATVDISYAPNNYQLPLSSSPDLRGFRRGAIAARQDTEAVVLDLVDPVAAAARKGCSCDLSPDGVRPPPTTLIAIIHLPRRFPPLMSGKP